MSEDGPIAARTLGLMIGRHIQGGLHEDIDVTNNGLNPVRFNLEIAIRADFADILSRSRGAALSAADALRRRGRKSAKRCASPIATRISAAR